LLGESHAEIARLNVRGSVGVDFQLAYEYDWPTYRRLKNSAALEHHRWQWGIFWDSGVLQPPWSREHLELPADMPVEEFLPGLTRAHVASKVRHVAIDCCR
jgi:hypothetical protein